MDKRFMKQVRRFFFFGTIFSGLSNLSKIFDETENELDDMLKSTVKWDKIKNQLGYDPHKDRKY